MELLYEVRWDSEYVDNIESDVVGFYRQTFDKIEDARACMLSHKSRNAVMRIKEIRDYE